MSQRIDKTNSERQARWQKKNRTTKTALITLTDALIQALDNGRASKIAKGLPEEPEARALELSERIKDIALVKFPKRL